MPDSADPPPIKPVRFDANPVIQPTPFQPARTKAARRGITISFGAVIIAAVLALCLASAWFVLTARSVYIETVPDDADVRVSDGFNIRLGDRLLMRSGEYRLGIAAAGYHPVEDRLDVGTEQNQQFRYILRPLPGHLRISAAPSSGAMISIDGAEPVALPPVVHALEPGEHRLRISADRYLPHEEAVVIEGRDTEQALVVTLQPAWAEITLTSEPPGADVLVDDVSVGTTPVTAEILQGRHDLRVQLSGYKARQRELSVTPGQARTLEPFVLEPADAVIALESRPKGAAVTVNGEYRGRTPLELAVEPGEPATVRLFLEGYRAATRTFTLQSGAKTGAVIELQAELVPIEFLVTPEDAELFIDGQSRGPASGVQQLPARAHSVRISKSGYVDYETSLTPRPGIAQQIRVSLKTVQQARLESIKPVITSGGGPTLKLFRPGAQFTMGASRREPGRRANESLRQVLLKRPFYLSEREITNDEFRRFRPDHSSGSVKGQTLDDPKQPVVRVTWNDAALYCNWLSARDGLAPFYQEGGGRVTGITGAGNGYRLATEAEWAWAARSLPDGGMLRFPWGDDMPPPPKSGNYADRSASALVGAIITGYQDGFAVTAPVGSFAANRLGLYDLGGNVAEWVHDYYDVTAGDSARVVTDPLGPASGEHHVIRGAGWAHGNLTELRLSFRDYGMEGRDDVGFRIARYLD